MEDQVVFQLLIEPDTLAEANEVAAARGITVNELIMIAVQQELADAFRESMEDRCQF